MEEQIKKTQCKKDRINKIMKVEVKERVGNDEGGRRKKGKKKRTEGREGWKKVRKKVKIFKGMRLGRVAK